MKIIYIFIVVFSILLIGAVISSFTDLSNYYGFKTQDCPTSFKGVKVCYFEGGVFEPQGLYRSTTNTIYLSKFYNILEPSTLYHEYCHYEQIQKRKLTKIGVVEEFECYLRGVLFY